MMRQLYRGIQRLLGNIQGSLHINKMFITEWWAIWRKRSMYREVTMDPAMRLAFDEYWITNYGKKISDRWHRQYASINSTLDKEYVPDVIYASRIEPRLNRLQYASLYSDKSLTELLYASVTGVVVPETIVLMADGYFYDHSRRVIDDRSCLEQLSQEQEFVIKPLVGGSSGQGVTFVRRGGRPENVHRERVRDLCSSFGSSGFIAQRILKPHESYRAIYPDSINTIRLVTFVAAGRVRVAPICLRMGQGGSEVDNIHAGGLVVGVNDDGVLLNVAYELGYSDSKVIHHRHPNTNTEFANYRVAGIKEMVEIALRMHGCTPRMGIISWDLMLDQNEQVVLVEANYLGQSVWFPQIAHGRSIFGSWTKDVLADFRVR